MANWCTADPHFGHKRIIEFCKRPFVSMAEMNVKIIGNFQSRVQPDGDLRIVGDVAFGHSGHA